MKIKLHPTPPNIITSSASPEIIQHQSLQRSSPFIVHGISNGTPITGYFISPAAKVIIVESTHIEKLIQCPEYFGFHALDIENLYQAYNEPLQSEKLSHAIIISEMLKNGWIRTHLNKSTWTIECWETNAKTQRNINKWIMGMLQHNLLSTKTEFVIKTLNNLSSASTLS